MNEMVSYCIECDALPGECDHKGPRYLDAPRYERVAGETPKDWIWKPSPEDSARMKSGSGYMNRPTTPVTKTAIPLTDLLAMIEEIVGLDDDLERLVASKYENEPLKTSKIVERGCTAPSMKSRGGFIVSRLREL
jgi:hypothetical protein